uniref:Uncharacterized protein n=1 Tax=Kalanchoe fedtschenkoi TaxID=63787 RepID=A0A7N0UP93_KALFE
MVSRKQEVLLPRRVASEVTNNDKINHPYRNGFHQEGGVSKSINKDEFEKQFPTTPVNEKQAVPDITRVASPVLTVAAQGLPVGSSALVGEGWSALAEVPAVIGSGDGGSGHANQPPEASSASRASSTDSGLNMADALAWSPVTTRTAPLVTTEAQKLEQMTIKQSRQLIPLTPVMPKPMVLSSADKLKPKTAVRSGDLNNTSKIGLQSHASGSAYVASHSPRGAHIMPEPFKTSQVGKLHVLKPPWENSASPVIMDGSALANDVGNKCLDTLATPAVSATPSRTSISSRASIMERKVAASNLNAPSVVDKKRMLSHVRSRNEFFNSVRKKSSMNTSSCSEAGSATSVPVEQSSEVVKETTIDTPSSNGVANGHSDCSGRALEVEQESSTKENNSICTIEVIPDEEEAAFLRSLGWEESCSDDDGLTEEEINTFYQQLMKLRPTLKLSEAVQHPKVSLLHELSVVGGSPRLAPSDSVLKFN